MESGTPFRRGSCLQMAIYTLLCIAVDAQAQVPKGFQILMNRGFQVQGIVANYDAFHLSTYSNANYTALHWLWGSDVNQHGPAPGFPWARWVSNQGDMPPVNSEGSYMSQLLMLQLGDEQELNNDAIRNALVDWFIAVRTNWPNTILYANNYGGQVYDTQLADFYTRAQPDMLSFDTYPYRSAPGYALVNWYGDLRRYREHAKGFNVPLCVYLQTYQSGSEGVRTPSASELRLQHFVAQAFSAKVLIDFTYNTGASVLFTNAFGGDNAPTPLYYEKADCAKRARNFGKALLRLKPVEDAVAQSYTTGMMFIRGRDASGSINAIPIGFLADPDAPNNYTDWVFQRNDPYLNGWSVTNKAGVRNGGTNGDVVISWFRPLDESFDGPNYTNEIYMMVVNAFSDPTGSPADCLQEIKLNFQNVFAAIDMLDSVSGQVTNVTLPVVNSKRQLTLNLNGGDAALFKFANGAPFVGFPFSTNAPYITTQPANVTVIVGSNATYTVTAGGSAPLSYQWRFNNGNISGATNTFYTRTNVQLSHAGDYTVVVTNSSGGVTSAVATLTVQTNTLVLYEPFDYSNVGSPVNSNTPANWVLGGSTAFNDCNVAPGNLFYAGLADSTGNSVTNGGGGYGVRRLLGMNLAGGTIYFSALFRINDLGYGAWNGLASQAGSLVATNNSTFRLQVMVKSNSPSGYVIGVQKGGTGAGATFDTTEFHAGDTVFVVGKYDFTTTPNPVTLWINPNPSTLGAGSAPATGFISTNSGTDNEVFDRFNIRQNVGSGSSSVPAAMQWDELRFGLSWSDVTPQGSSMAPQITTSPQSQIVNETSNVTFAVVATGNPTPSYQWRFNGANISGATNTFFTRTNVQSGDAGSYTALATNLVGSVTSAVAILAVNTSPIITTQPQSRTVNPGSNVLFTVVANGSPLPSYQWRFNATNIANATTSSLTVTNAQFTNAGSYAVIVSNSVNSITSSNAILAVNVPASITIQPTNQTIFVGSNVTFVVSASGTLPLSYQWRFNGTNISNANATSFTRTDVQLIDAGTYTVTVTNVAGSVTSLPAVLNVVPPLPLRFDSIEMLSNRQVRLRGSSPGQFIIEGTETLSTWTELTNLPVGDGTFEFIDTATNFFQRYYRARLTP
jgi:hypothetical protein